MDELFLLQSQIQDSCKLSLPEGLKDLMSDISREVLRTQPSNLYHFITDYLSAMLVARETLSITCRVCRDVCECCCNPELEEELKNIGLVGDDLETVKDVVIKYFDKGGVKEGNLLMELMKKTKINEQMLPAIQDAVRKAFMMHQMYYMRGIKVSPDETIEKSQKAARKTLTIYEKLHDDKNLKDRAATKIQAFYRGHQIRCKLSKTIVNFKVKVKNAVKAAIEAASTIQLQQQMDSQENVKRILSSSSRSTFSDYEEQEERRKNDDRVRLSTIECSIGEEKETMRHELSVLPETEIEEEEESVTEEIVIGEGIEEEIVEDLQSDERSVDEDSIGEFLEIALRGDNIIA